MVEGLVPICFSAILMANCSVCDAPFETRCAMLGNKSCTGSAHCLIIRTISEDEENMLCSECICASPQQCNHGRSTESFHDDEMVLVWIAIFPSLHGR